MTRNNSKCRISISYFYRITYVAKIFQSNFKSTIKQRLTLCNLIMYYDLCVSIVFDPLLNTEHVKKFFFFTF